MSDVTKRILLTLASGVYLASPVDLIPDIIPALGLADDTVFLLLMLYAWYTMFQKPPVDDKPVRKGSSRPRVIDVKPVEVDPARG
ncbi:MAG: DUF1232 domain-containing protein [Acidobacteria bacterium]|nr:DUF1232 domain-containing protein [Acidobacteriota bacterium]